MLLEFKVKNFLSIKEEVVLSMIPTADQTLKKNLIKSSDKEESLLRTASIYGANASGKTNILRALDFLRKLIINNTRVQKGEKLAVTPFKLDEEYSNQPSEFEVHFIHDGIKYVYGLVVDSVKVHEEFLIYYPKGRKSVIFERFDVNEYDFKVDRGEQILLSKRTLENRLYLSTSTEWNYERTAKALEWFQEKLRVWTDPDDFLPQKTIDLLEYEEFKKLLINFMADADVGIRDLSINFEDVTGESEMSRILEILREGHGVKRKPSSFQKVSIETFHEGRDKDGNKVNVPFDFKEESRGTQKLFHLLGYWFEAMMTNKVLVIDELETSIHPILAEQLLKIFQLDLESSAQLIFTTHNTNFLNGDIFRRDQIWFTEKNPKEGCTVLYALSDMKPRKQENFEKGYLAGRYGGVPILGEGLSSLLWRDPEN
ncbi:AAA family ATPase [Bacillus thuringiensis]|uniref:AAA family ATPase n=1 Tax=Bacillus thuringiensis TaxID=1428 RepID=UPI000CF878A7|nr:ATP-binding protein [Bacillus thuringiensis]PQQ47018.1 hypothetical protein C6A34_13545 [Bacillus thuringiensis]